MQNNLQLKEDIRYPILPISNSTAIELDLRLGNQITKWFIFLLTLLIADGILTYIGISHSSTKYEANVFVRSTMELFGVGSGIILSKLLAIVSLSFLWAYRNEIVWIFSAIKALIFIYLSFAIIPWTYVLTNILNVF